jgi:hypothetical protein
LREREEG